MSSTYPPISFCCGVYNEEEILLEKLDKIKSGLIQIMGPQNFEIIITDNGSTDKTPEILKNLHDPLIRPFFTSQRGHGLAHRTNILNAKYEHVLLTGIDLPFGFMDLEQVLPIWDQYDIVVGSKAHPQSKIEYPWQRKVSSFFFRKLLRLFFNIKIRDPQGAVFLHRSTVLPLLKFATETNTFFTTQLIIYATSCDFNMTEVPVTMIQDKHKRKSRYKLIQDSKAILKSMLKEYKKLQKLQPEIEELKKSYSVRSSI